MVFKAMYQVLKKEYLFKTLRNKSSEIVPGFVGSYVGVVE